MVVATDAEWRGQKIGEEGWNISSSFDDSAWPGAAVLGDYDALPWEMQKAEEHRRLPARMLRREFQVEKTIRRATAQVCGLGCFELYINGQKVDDHIMDPTYSNTSKRAFYVTFDVSKYLRSGDNAVGVWLGNGRFFSRALQGGGRVVTSPLARIPKCC